MLKEGWVWEKQEGTYRTSLLNGWQNGKKIQGLKKKKVLRDKRHMKMWRAMIAIVLKDTAHERRW